ncbi:Putative peptidoglycan-binding domain-containing protein [Aquiflexum balticum DSM 16537]|uniref:Putative peptidoglycan-binding domain-containing protein n=1 Tax=Aquiflexum balticum DSM 16537 TaxID=758820 RepID=A0A1W2H8W6_9BACT|nr:P-loop NTPase fold protein [Aquiflexum balticum]SMD45311.1 Putative peptidoglycan-binding domain-containing protein [Aquiflexum balticum DSM 16537]
MAAPVSSEPIQLLLFYAREDQSLAFYLKELLSKYGYRIIELDEGLEYGKSWETQLSRNLEIADGFIFLITKSNIKSDFLNIELEQAYKHLSGKRKILLPIIDSKLPIPSIIENINVIRFSPLDDFSGIAENIHQALVYWQRRKTEGSSSGTASNKTTSTKSDQRDSRNENTLEIQKILKELGFFNGFVDGIMGPQTRSAIMDFQKYHQLEPSGIWDEKAEELSKYSWSDKKASANRTKIQTEEPQKETPEMEEKGDSKFAEENVESEKEEGKAEEIEEEEGDVFTLSQVFADSTAKEIKDQLDFEVDVNALASVIAYREVKPPLAIGLFGNWGSGKSFFMNKLQERIDFLQGDEKNIFCKKILQINFNSWHYSDANLWASLITKIFDDLNSFGKEKPENLNALFKNLNSTKELLNDTKVEKDRVEGEIKILNQQKKIFEEAVEKNSNDLVPLDFEEIFKGVLQNSTVQSDIQKLKETYPLLNLEGINEIDQNINQLDTNFERLKESIKTLYSFRHGKSWFAIFVAFLVAIGVMLFISNTELGNRYLEQYKVLLTLTGTLLSQFLLFIQPYTAKLENIWKRLNSLKKTRDDLRELAREKYQVQKDIITQKVNTTQNQADKIQQKIDLLTIEKSKLEKDIDEILSGRKILKFIEGRVADERYINSLGIISWIRKDFEQLDSLLRQQGEIGKLTEIEQQQIKDFQLDRIILYIDDLDRCSEEIVVKVLEAIHLLLAFPLFVVIVGVDPRWMHRALNVHYSKLLAGSSVSAVEASLNMAGTGHPATSFDYLEKIFQIPFALRPMDDIGIKNLIKSQFEIKPAISPPIVLENQAQLKDMPEEAVISASIEEKVTPVEPEVREQISEVLTPIDIEQKPNQIPIKIETLIISEEEVDFIQAVSSIFGDSPRTVKRYTNIYRIIRTHNNFKAGPDETILYHKAAIIMLAIITGQSNLAKDILKMIREAKPSNLFEDFLSEKSQKGLKIEFKESQLLTFLLGLYDTKSLKKKTLKLDHFQKNMNLVSRFSFKYI